ncbi:hypothetical protein GALMADRAFT_143556 [Galerina marginata CBS 339.88]|uniref:Uncharacterized protein n=1 Tax=Galerina marginata (strain CBS 339.88) TaxID=685588 RepID=A0A067SVM9_GALM3|nr:hypothetical protein GALMADRAFT_143556 [Galerina marginata CBS 339.88]
MQLTCSGIPILSSLDPLLVSLTSPDFRSPAFQPAVALTDSRLTRNLSPTGIVGGEQRILLTVFFGTPPL